MNEKLNIETCATAAENLFSNDIVECHNLIVTEAMEKTLQDEKCEPEITLVWTISAKNALQTFWDTVQMSLYINTYPVLTDQLPASEAVTTSEMVRINLNALHAVRKSFIEADSSEKIWRTLRSNVKTYVDDGFVTGNIVYYRRQTARYSMVLLKYLVRKISEELKDNTEKLCRNAIVNIK